MSEIHLSDKSISRLKSEDIRSITVNLKSVIFTLENKTKYIIEAGDFLSYTNGNSYLLLRFGIEKIEDITHLEKPNIDETLISGDICWFLRFHAPYNFGHFDVGFSIENK